MAQIEFVYDTIEDPVEGTLNQTFSIDENSYKLVCHKFWDGSKYVVHNGPRKAGDLKTDAENGADQGDYICCFGPSGTIRRLLSRTPPPA